MNPILTHLIGGICIGLGSFLWGWIARSRATPSAVQLGAETGTDGGIAREVIDTLPGSGTASARYKREGKHWKMTEQRLYIPRMPGPHTLATYNTPTMTNLPEEAP